MVLFFHCADDDDDDDDDELVLHHREEETGCCVKICPLVVYKNHSEPNFWHQQPSFPFLTEHFEEETSTHWDDMTSTLIQPHQLNGLFLVAKDKRETPLLSEVAQKLPLRDTKSRTSSPEPVTCCTVCFVRRHVNTKDVYTLSRAGLLLPKTPSTLRHHVNRTEEITERQTALAPSVRRVYMTMLKWGDFKWQKNLLLAVTYIDVTVLCFRRSFRGATYRTAPPSFFCLLVISTGRLKQKVLRFFFSFVFTSSICTNNESFLFCVHFFYLFLYFGQN